MRKLLDTKAGATFYEEMPNLTLCTRKDCIEFIFKLKPGIYVIINMTRGTGGKIMLYANWDKYFMRMVGDAENEVTIDPTRIHVGDRVRIKTGKLAGLEANICKEPDGRTLLALRVDFLGYAKMECPIANLELVKQ